MNYASIISSSILPERTVGRWLKHLNDHAKDLKQESTIANILLGIALQLHAASKFSSSDNQSLADPVLDSSCVKWDPKATIKQCIGGVDDSLLRPI